MRAGDRPHYIPVIYVEPFTNNEAAMGYDLNSNPTRAAAVQQARDTGEITATGRIRLVQEKRDQIGFLVFLPVYQDARIPDSLEQQRERLEGFLLGVFQVSDVDEESLQDLKYDIDFALYDQSASPKEQFLGFYDATRKRVTLSAVANKIRHTIRRFCVLLLLTVRIRSRLDNGSGCLCFPRLRII